MWPIYKRLPVTFGTNRHQMVTGTTNTGDERQINELLSCQITLLKNKRLINHHTAHICSFFH